jgi:hypothetical protein
MNFIDTLVQIKDSIKELIQEIKLGFNVDVESLCKKLENQIGTIIEETGGMDDNVMLSQMVELHETIADIVHETDIELDDQDSASPLLLETFNSINEMRDELDNSHLIKPNPYQI